jgi:rubrerythrin
MADQQLVRIFEYALNQEKTGISFFKASIERMGIGAAVSAFNRLIQEEEKHVEFINKILNSLASNGEITEEALEKVSFGSTDFFDDRAKAEFLQQCVEGSMVPDVTVFNTAWLIEKDLGEFYARMAGQTSGKAKDALEMLSRWEKEHERFFREYRDKLSQVYANMPWGG